MTASRPTTPATARYNQVNHQVNPSNNVLAKRTRGPINKRACQRCRQGKIKCDGDAETGKPCSNCDPQHCKYDNSPRKNKQVESLKIRLSTVEEQLVAITTDVSEKLYIKDLEKEILCLLYETKGHFINNSSQVLFHGLRDALKQSRCLKPVLTITFELLTRLADDNNENFIPEIMKSLQRFVECASTFEKDSSILPTVPSSDEIFKKIENYCQTGAQPYPQNDGLVMLPLPLDNSQVHLNLHSADDSGGDNSSTGYEYEDASSPSTPPKRLQQQQQQQIHSDSKCYNGSNNLTHIQNQQPIIGTSTGSDYPATFSYGNENMYQYYHPNTEYVMENNYPGLYLVNEPPNTTSPTDEAQMGPWP